MFVTKSRTKPYAFAGMLPLFTTALALGILVVGITLTIGNRDADIADCLSKFEAGPRVCVKHYQHPSYPDGDSGTNLAFRCGRSYTEDQVRQCTKR